MLSHPVPNVPISIMCDASTTTNHYQPPTNHCHITPSVTSFLQQFIMQSVSFTGREEVEAATKPIILVNCVEYYDVLLQMESLTALKAGDVISTIYWMLDITNDAEGVDYTKAKTDLNLGERAVIGTVTARARQLVAYTALCAMMGYVKELTTQNMDAGFKRWRAGLASQTLPDLLTDALKKEI